MIKKLWLPIAIIALSTALAHAEVNLKEVQWGFRPGSNVSVRRPAFQKADQWMQPPANKLLIFPKIVVTLLNRGPIEADGVVLRYAISARIASIKSPSSRGTWVVPIWVDWKRVPIVRPNTTHDVQIDPMRLATSMREMYRAGFWPNMLKIQVMVEPRQGEDISQKVSEKTISVEWHSAVK